MTDERERLQVLYARLLEVTDETAHPVVDLEGALDVCRMLSSGRGAVISHLDAQVATLTAERNEARADLCQTNELYYAATDEATNLQQERDDARVERDGAIALLKFVADERDHLQRSVDLICEMAAQLTDPTAYELIQDILHPKERR